MDTDNRALEDFGRFVIEHLRDGALASFDHLLAYTNLHPNVQHELRQTLAPWDESQQMMVRKCIALAIDNAIHDLLFQLNIMAENKEFNQGAVPIQILSHQKDVTELDDSLQLQLHGPDGWIKKYSSYVLDDIV